MFWAAAPGGKHPRRSPPPPRKRGCSQARSPATARATNNSQGRSRRLRCVVSLLHQRDSCHRAVCGASRRARRGWTRPPGQACAPLYPSISGRVSRVCDSLLRSELEALHGMRLRSQLWQQAAGARAGRGAPTIWRSAGWHEDGRSALERCLQVVTMSTPAAGQARSAGPAGAGRLAALGPPAPRPRPSACVRARRHAHRAWKLLKRCAPVRSDGDGLLVRSNPSLASTAQEARTLFLPPGTPWRRASVLAARRRPRLRFQASGGFVHN